MICKSCQQIETDNTSGICWKCANRTYFQYLLLHPEETLKPQDTSSVYAKIEIIMGNQNFIDWAMSRHT